MMWFILGVQFVILLGLGWILRNGQSMARHIKEATKLLEQYRSEMEWMKARIDMLETRNIPLKAVK